MTAIKPLPTLPGLIIPKPRATCGNCHFHSATPDLSQIMCNGVPPTPCIVGAQQTVQGPAFEVELMSPRLPRSRQGCALHRFIEQSGEMTQ